MRFRLAILVLGLFFSLFSVADVSGLVLSESKIYDRLDWLEIYDCAHPSYRASTPQAYRELQEILIRGENEAPCAAPEWLLKDREMLRTPFVPNEARAVPLLLYQDIIPLNHLEASTTPQFPTRAGRITFDGPNLYLEADTRAQTGRNLGVALEFSPGWDGAFQKYQNFFGRFYVQEGHARLVYKKSELMIGRINLRLATFRHAGLLLTGAGKPLNLIRFNIRPHVLGDPFGFLGYVTFDLWLAQGGDTAFRSGSNYVGMLLGLRPSVFWETSLLGLFQIGGKGIASLQVGDLPSLFLQLSSPELDQKRQKAFLWQNSFWGPSHYFNFYAQILFDGSPSLDPQSGDPSYSAGLWFPRLGGANLRLEYAQTSSHAYQSKLWPQGFSFNGTPLGSALGTDARGFYLDFGIAPLAGWRPTLQFAYELRDRGAKNSNPLLDSETRYGVGLEILRRWNQVELSVLGKYGHVTNHGYLPTADGSNNGLWANLTYLFI